VSGPLSKSDIAAKLGQKQPSGQLHKVIRSLLAENTITYTIPDKPQSRLQKYKLVFHPDGKVIGEKPD
jgi:ATP-dependent DNA helicase RecG